MITIATVRKFTATVKFTTLAEDGSQKPASYKAVFKGLDLPEYQDLMKRANAEGVDGDALVVEEVLLGFEDVRDADGNPVEFSAESRDALMRVLGCRPATVRTFIDRTTGARQGN